MRLYSIGAPVLTQLDVDRFWAKVRKGKPEECWYWLAGLTGGYGLFGIRRDGKTINFKAHQLAYELTIGPIGEGLQARHSCHNRACCNPAHIKPGTHQDNMNDMTDADRQAKGERHGTHTKPESRRYGKENGAHTKPTRVRKGEDNGTHILTDKQVKVIRAEYRHYSRDRGLAYFADLFGISKMTIHTVTTGKNWRHVSG